MNELNQLVDHLFRHESGKMVAVLTRLFGFKNYDIAQDIVQETLLSALDNWKLKGIPENPTAWLYSVAKNKTVDMLRREKLFDEIAPEIAHQTQNDERMQNRIDHLFLDNEIEDSLLRMMFACCHPALPIEGQIALILRTLCGLSIEEVAKALLSNPENINKRLYRTKDKIRAENIELEVPIGNELLDRLDDVLRVIYLLFNEGYNSTSTDLVIKKDLCEEAIRLGHLLINHSVTNQPKCRALLALMYFQASRFDARIDDEGNIVLLQFQNRHKWNKELISNGFYFLNQSSEGNEISEYHIEAAIASYHARAESFEATHWQAILVLYRMLDQIKPSPIVKFNQAIAIGFVENPQKAIEALLSIEGLENNQYYQSALGDFYTKLNDAQNARQHYEKAIKLTKSKAEWKLIWDKIEKTSDQ